MIKGINQTYRGMSQDISKSKHPHELYYEGKNIRIISTDQQSTGAVINEHGNELLVTIPAPSINIGETRIDYISDAPGNPGLNFVPYTRNTPAAPGGEIEVEYVDFSLPNSIKLSGEQTIIGRIEARDSVILATTDGEGFDCIWELSGFDTGSYSLTLKYLRNLGFSKSSLIQILYNYENSVLEKIYWVDGKSQLRFLNLRHSIANGDLEELMDMPATSVNMVGDFSLSQATISSIIGGGSHTAGMIQYAYNLYRINGAQTGISPLSELVSLDLGPGQGGAEVNTNVGRTVIINLDNLDPNYTHIKLYSIKYTSFNETPTISVVVDKEIDDYNSIVYHDDGLTTTSISLEEFLFLGSDPIVPKHIESKDSRLFPINVKEKDFDFDIDCRAYSYNNAGFAYVRDNLEIALDASGNPFVVGTSFPIAGLPEENDAVNPDYDEFIYQEDGTTLGAEGLFLKIKIDTDTLNSTEAINYRFFKDRELYRIGIKFYNSLGQETVPKWICDYKMPSGNLIGNYNKLEVELKPEFYTELQTVSAGLEVDQIPIGYKILRANRELKDQTIITQGILGAMIANHRHDGKLTDLTQRRLAADSPETSKMPSFLRHFGTEIFPIIGYKNYHCLAWKDFNDSTFGDLGRTQNREGFKAAGSGNWRAQNYQYNHLMTIHSPDTIFGDVNLDASMKVKVVGLAKESDRGSWGSETNPVSNSNTAEAKFYGGFNNDSATSVTTLSGASSFIYGKGMFGPTNASNHITIWQMYRNFNGQFTYNPNIQNNYEIYGTPEIAERGQDFKSYNGDFQLRFSMHLRAMLMDNFDDDDTNSDAAQQILGTNSDMSRCIVFAEGSDVTGYPLEDRKTPREFYDEMGINEPESGMIVEVVKDPLQIYIGNLYGGNSYEAKRSTDYIEIGEYQDIGTSSHLILSPGDTYVQEFTFARITKGDVENTAITHHRATEIIVNKLETPIDLKNRHDISRYGWENRFSPTYDEYHQYNRVYSQQATLVRSTDVGFKFKKVREFDTRIMTSKIKVPGENIDSWTDLLINETIDLDGGYGPINGTVNFNDEIYTFQDTGIAHISINPRVQVSGSDGLATELGAGGILHDYQYLTTKSGSVNKWSIFSSPSSFYYVDLINKSIGRFSGGIIGLSDSKGMHQFLINNIDDTSLLRADNPVLDSGISGGFNTVNNDAYFTFRQGAKGNTPFTISFNEGSDSFVSLYDYIPAWYINKGDVMITTNPTTGQLWEHFKGTKNSFYGTVYPSSITLNVNPRTGRDVVFNNAEYKMEMTSAAGVDLPAETFNSVRLWNDYQDTTETPLTLRRNINRKFRSWKISFPRQQGSMDRIRNPWTFVKLTFDNPDGKRMVLHDINISYTEY